MFFSLTGSEWAWLLIYMFTVIPTIIVILLENRNPVKSLSWLLVLVFLPIVGLIVYLYLGQDYRKQKIVAKKSIRRLHDRPKLEMEQVDIEHCFLPQHLKQMVNLLYNNGESAAYGGNRITVFGDGEATFEALFEAIENAKKEIHIEFYIIENDDLGKRFCNLLLRKAKEGLRVRLIYDYVGSFRFKKKVQKELRTAGVELFPFLPVHFKITIRKNRINYRNHRKCIVIDNCIGFTGGLNIANRYLFGNKLGKWRDTFIRIDGPAVHGLQYAFLTDWFFVSQELLIGNHYYPVIEPKNMQNSMVQIVSSGPDSDWETIMQGIYTAIATSTRYVYVQTPYLMPPEIIMTALQVAALSGVDVRVMIPSYSDTPMTQSCSLSYVAQLLEAGVKIYLYCDAFLHSKTIVIDDIVSTVGSTNMDFRSYEQNFELNAFIYNAETAVELRELFLKDQQQCRQIVFEEWNKRPVWNRLKESVARLFSPLL